MIQWALDTRRVKRSGYLSKTKKKKIFTIIIGELGEFLAEEKNSAMGGIWTVSV